MKKRDEGYTAILVDGGFYRKRAYKAFGDKDPKERASELDEYCKRHLIEKNCEHRLYRIFYYDCYPMDCNVWNPFLQKDINFSKTDQYKWSNEFYEELKHRRKFALRLGTLASRQAHFNLDQKVTKKLLSGRMTLDEITESDLVLNVDQKGVDMKIGIDIASLAYKKQVNQIVLIAGDSDFVPAAKLARREGIDFVLDPLGGNIKDSLYEHIDGLRTCDNRFKCQNSSKEKNNK